MQGDKTTMVYQRRSLDTRLGLEEEGRRLLIWATSRSDQDMAEKLGISSAAVVHWRSGRGIPSRDDIRNANRLAAWRKSRNDKEAAALLGISTKAFSSWREANQLPPCLGNKSVRHSRRRFKPDWDLNIQPLRLRTPAKQQERETVMAQEVHA